MDSRWTQPSTASSGRPPAPAGYYEPPIPRVRLHRGGDESSLSRPPSSVQVVRGQRRVAPAEPRPSNFDSFDEIAIERVTTKPRRQKLQEMSLPRETNPRRPRCSLLLLSNEGRRSSPCLQIYDEFRFLDEPARDSPSSRAPLTPPSDSTSKYSPSREASSRSRPWPLVALAVVQLPAPVALLVFAIIRYVKLFQVKSSSSFFILSVVFHLGSSPRPRQARRLCREARRRGRSSEGSTRDGSLRALSPVLARRSEWHLLAVVRLDGRLSPGVPLLPSPSSSLRVVECLCSPETRPRHLAVGPLRCSLKAPPSHAAFLQALHVFFVGVSLLLWTSAFSSAATELNLFYVQLDDLTSRSLLSFSSRILQL